MAPYFRGGPKCRVLYCPAGHRIVCVSISRWAAAPAMDALGVRGVLRGHDSAALSSLFARRIRICRWAVFGMDTDDFVCLVAWRGCPGFSLSACRDADRAPTDQMGRG